MTIRPLSSLLEDVKASMDGQSQVKLADLITAFHERGFGFFMFLFALPAALPLPAVGLGTILAMPLIFLTAQQAYGRHTIWLPDGITRRTLDAEQMRGIIETAMPWIEKLELLFRPRLGIITQKPFSFFAGIAGFIMAVAVLFPIPLTNTVPSMGIALMSIGILMRDGLAIIAGMVLGLLWVFLLVYAVSVFGPEGLDWIKETVKSYLP